MELPPRVQEPGAKRSGQDDVDGWIWTTGFQEGRPYKEIEEELRRALITEALSRADGITKEAARLLGTTPNALTHALKRMGISRDKWSCPKER